MNRRAPLLLFVLTLALAAAPASACPMCKDAIPNSDAQSAESLPGGFNTSIYYMLAGVFSVAATGAFFVVRTIRQTDRASASAARGFPVRAQ